MCVFLSQPFWEHPHMANVVTQKIWTHHVRISVTAFLAEHLHMAYVVTQKIWTHHVLISVTDTLEHPHMTNVVTSSNNHQT